MSKCSLPKLNDCVNTVPRPVSLSDRRVSHAVFMFIVVAVLCLGHVYLRFAIRDMKLQHKNLQHQVRSLIQQQSDLIHGNEALCNVEELRNHGRFQLQMVEPSHQERLIASVSTEARARYSEEAISLPMQFAEAEENALSPVKKVLLSLVDVNKAFAGRLEK